MPDHFHFRPANLKNDKPLLIELECELNYENESHLKEQFDFKEYHRRWHTHHRPDRVYDSFKDACGDKRTICEFMETTEGEPAGFIMVTFQEIKGFDCLTAFLEDIYVYPRFRKQGIGSSLLEHLETKAQAAGAKSLSLATGSGNNASNRLFMRNGYTMHRHGYEKQL